MVKVQVENPTSSLFTRDKIRMIVSGQRDGNIVDVLPLFVSCCSSNLQGELWPLCGPLQGLLGVVGLRQHSVPLLGEPIGGDEVREALWKTESV